MNRTTYLFTRPSFRRGVSRLVDLGGVLNDNAYHISSTAEESDALALYADWYAVGDDMRAAIDGVIRPGGQTAVVRGKKKKKGSRHAHAASLKGITRRTVG